MNDNRELKYQDESGDNLRVWMTDLQEAQITVGRGVGRLTLTLPPKTTRQLRDMLITNCDTSEVAKQIPGIGHYFVCRECYKRYSQKSEAQQCCNVGIGYFCQTCLTSIPPWQKPDTHFVNGKCPKENK